MAEYKSWFRTTYFQVTNKAKLEEIISKIPDAELLVHSTDPSLFGFAGEDGYEEETIEALQAILPDGEAIVIQEVGHEKLNYVVGTCLVITNKDTKYVNMQNEALHLARNMTGKQELLLDFDY